MRAPNVNPWVVAFVVFVTVVVIVLAYVWVGILRLDDAGAQEKRDSSCPFGNTCTWSSSGFTGGKATFGASFAPLGYFNAVGRSAKNRFGDRSARFKSVNGNVFCLRAGRDRDNVSFTWVDVSPRGAGCLWKSD